jgi:hypothetical protein
MFNPIWIGNTEPISLSSCHGAGNVYNPVDCFDTSKGSNEIIVHFDADDLPSLPSTIKRWPLISCTDRATIQQICQNFQFECLEIDYLETTEGNSQIYFLKDGHVFFQCPFHFEGNIAIKPMGLGWIFALKSDSLSNLFAQFKPMYIPLIVCE